MFCRCLHPHFPDQEIEAQRELPCPGGTAREWEA